MLLIQRGALINSVKNTANKFLWILAWIIGPCTVAKCSLCPESSADKRIGAF